MPPTTLTLDALAAATSPVVIFGASVAGQAVALACREAGIAVAAFCDNNADKTRQPCAGLEVIHRPKLRERFPDAIVLVAVIDIRDIVDQLAAMGYDRVYPVAGLLRHFDAAGHDFGKPAPFVDYVISACVLSQDHYANPDAVYIRGVDLVVTERCTLKCRDCSNLMQYYKHPVDYPAADVLRDLDTFCEAVDEVNEFRVIGGEPFMNRDWPGIVGHLLAQPKVRKTVIYTNATIMPSDAQWDVLRHPKVLFIVTDYGPLSRRAGAMAAKLRELGIAHVVNPVGGWTDCAAIRRHGRTPDELREVFGACCVKNSFTLMNGRLFRCPFAANLHALGAAPDAPRDSVDLAAPASAGDRRRRLRALIDDTESLAACDFCNGRRYGDPTITPAVQVGKPLEF